MTASSFLTFSVPPAATACTRGEKTHLCDTSSKRLAAGSGLPVRTSASHTTTSASALSCSTRVGTVIVAPHTFGARDGVAVESARRVPVNWTVPLRRTAFATTTGRYGSVGTAMTVVRGPLPLGDLAYAGSSPREHACNARTKKAAPRAEKRVTERSIAIE